MPNSYFKSATYHTPANHPRFFRDKLALNTRFYFIWKFSKIILKAKKASVQGCYDDIKWAGSSHAIFKLIEGCGGRFHLTGLDNIDHCQGPVVFISNHMSTLETMIFPVLIAPVMKVTFVVKESLVTHPVFGPVMRSRNPIVVGRNNSREDLHKVLTEGQEWLAKGVSVIIFPQSTRTANFNPQEFNTLGVKLAGKAGVQVVPVAIKTDFWENGKLVKDFGPIKRRRGIYMNFGAPLTITGNGKEEHKQIVEFIEKNLKEWKEH